MAEFRRDSLHIALPIFLLAGAVTLGAVATVDSIRLRETGNSSAAKAKCLKDYRETGGGPSYFLGLTPEQSQELADGASPESVDPELAKALAGTAVHTIDVTADLLSDQPNSAGNSRALATLTEAQQIAIELGDLSSKNTANVYSSLAGGLTPFFPTPKGTHYIGNPIGEPISIFVSEPSC